MCICGAARGYTPGPPLLHLPQPNRARPVFVSSRARSYYSGGWVLCWWVFTGPERLRGSRYDYGGETGKSRLLQWQYRAGERGTGVVRDRGFTYGDAVFDMTRTFGHEIFKLEEHIARFYDSLRYVQIDPGMGPDEMIDLTNQVLEENLKLIGEDEDYWVGQRVSRGVDLVGGDMWETDGGPTVVIECKPLPLSARARLYRDGIDVFIPSVRRTPPESVSPRAKSHNYLNLIMGDLEVKAQDPEGWALLLDSRGFLAEGIGSNIFTVKGGVLYTPRPQYVLGASPERPRWNWPRSWRSRWSRRTLTSSTRTPRMRYS